MKFPIIASILLSISLTSAAILPQPNFDFTIILVGLIFIATFAILFYPLSASFKDNKAVAGVIALSISLTITYSILASGINLELYLGNFGIPKEMLISLIPWIGLGFLIFVIVKIGWGKTIILAGAFSILSSLFSAEKETLFLLGIILILVGLFISTRKKEKEKIKFY